jgi:hypothetical protein
MSELDDFLGPRLRVMQIIAATILLGAVAFAVIALSVVWGQNGGRGLAPPAGLPILSVVAAFVLATNGLLAAFFPRVVTRAVVRRIAASLDWPPGKDAEFYAEAAAQLLASRQTTMIIALALLEGAAFLGGFAYLLEAQPLALGVVGAAVFLMLLHYPTRDRVRAWIERQADRVRALRRPDGGAGV